MVKVTFVRHDGARRSIEGRSGQSLMEAAMEHGVDGIDAICGGACSCATCHVYVDAAWQERLVAPTAMESGMMDALEARRPASRLACQIKLCEDLDGLVVTTPPAQQP